MVLPCFYTFLHVSDGFNAFSGFRLAGISSHQAAYMLHAYHARHDHAYHALGG